MVLGLGATLLAQAPSKNTSDQATKVDVVERHDTEAFYKLSFVLYELEDGKRTNQREYGLMAKSGGGPASVRVLTRVPMYSEEKKVNYINAGVDIRCSLRDTTPVPTGKIQASCEFEISNFAHIPNPATDSAATLSTGAPVLRTTNTSTVAVLTPGKPAVISTIDDVNSKKRTQIEMTATRTD
jgi:hypothetical protein